MEKKKQKKKKKKRWHCVQVNGRGRMASPQNIRDGFMRDPVP
jgi:hypothetical protein